MKTGLFFVLFVAVALLIPAFVFAGDVSTNFFDLVKTGTAKQVQAAITKGGVDLTAIEDTDNKTPLLWAASYNPDPKVITVLLKAGATLSEVDKEGSTVLMDAAAENPNPDVAALILKDGANIKDQDHNGITALMWAAGWNPNVDMLKLMLKAGSDLETKSNDGLTALTYAARNSTNPKVITTLVAAGADIEALNKDGGSTPLMFAASFNKNPDITTALLKAGAKLEYTDDSGCTALFDAVGNDNVPAVIQVLVDAGANVNVVETSQNMTPLMMAASLAKHPDQTLPILIKAGADVNAKDKDGNTSLMLAAGIADNPKTIEILLAAGADATIKNNNGSTVQDFADFGAKKGHTNVQNSDVYQTLLMLIPQVGILTIENETAYTITITSDGVTLRSVEPFTRVEVGSLPVGDHSLTGKYLPDPNRGNWGPRTFTMGRDGWKWTLTATTMTVTNKSNNTVNVYLDNSFIITLQPGGQYILNVNAGDHTGYAQGSTMRWGPTPLHFNADHDFGWNLLQ
jgi:ankyrin repeat protein